MIYPLYIGCTKARHKELGIHAVVNARGGMQHLNDHPLDTPQEMEMWRDAWKVIERRHLRVAIHQFNSRWFRRRLAHLITPYD
jgi:hypothetical protein